MIPDTMIGRRLFVDGITRPVFLDDAAEQYLIDLDGHTRLYRVCPSPEEADAALLVSCPEPTA